MSHRRYKIGLNPRYDKTFDRVKSQSPFLNPAVRESQGAWQNPEFVQSCQKNGLVALIRQFGGDGDKAHPGQWLNRLLDPPRWEPSFVMRAEEAIAAVDEDFENMKLRAVRSGRIPPEEMPQELVDRRLVAEAAADVLREELDSLRRELETKYVKKEQARQDSKILVHGPQGACMGADPVRETDGQKVEWNKELGQFVINCPASPYHSMTLPDYFIFICAPYRAARNAAHDEAAEKLRDMSLTVAERSKWQAIYHGQAPIELPPRPENL